MNKKLKFLIMFFLIIQCVFVIFNYCKAASGEKVSFSVSNATGKIGDEVSIDIKLNDRATFVSTNLVLNYDNEVLEYISHTEGEILKNGAMNIVKNNSEQGKVALGYVASPSEGDEIIYPGKILTIVFKLKSNLEKETDLKLECTSLKNKEGSNITSIITNGRIEKLKDNTNGNDNTNNNDSVTGDNNNSATDHNQSNIDTNSNNNNNNTNNNKPNIDNNNKPTTSIKPEEEEIQDDLPKAGISSTTTIILIILIFTSIILYYKNKSMEQI